MKNKEDSLILSKFLSAQQELVTQSSDLSLMSITDMVASGSIDIAPKYQRRVRWDINKQSILVESFILGMPVPPVYLAEDEYGVYSVIDGKQRITAISLFMSGKILLQGLEKFKELNGKNINDLPIEIVNALKIRPYVRVVTLLKQSDPELKHEVFIRLNKAGVVLNSQEIRNVAYRGKFNDLLVELSQHPYIVKQLNSDNKSTVYREMQDVQYVLRFFTVQSTWELFPGNMDYAMDKFMKEHYKDDDIRVENFRQSFLSTIKVCESIWGSNGFMKPGGSRRVLQGFYDIQMVCISLLSTKEKEKLIEKRESVVNGLIDLIGSDKEFEDSTTQFTSNMHRIKYRINTFNSLLNSVLA